MLRLALTAARQERRSHRREHLAVDQVFKSDFHEPVSADHDGGAWGHPGRSCKSRSAVETQMQPRLRLREPASVHLTARGKEDQEVDEVFIGICDRGTFE